MSICSNSNKDTLHMACDQPMFPGKSSLVECMLLLCQADPQNIDLNAQNDGHKLYNFTRK